MNNEIKQESRILIKRSTIPGEIPTINTGSTTHTSGWTGTDIYPGEIFINTIDDKVWFRGSDIVQIYPSASGGTQDVFLYDDYASFSGTSGTVDKLYIAKDSSTGYWWNSGTLEYTPLAIDSVEWSSIINGPSSTIVEIDNAVNLAHSISAVNESHYTKTESDAAAGNPGAKVDKEAGKGLSTNDFTDIYKGILDSGITQVVIENTQGEFPIPGEEDVLYVASLDRQIWIWRDDITDYSEIYAGNTDSLEELIDTNVTGATDGQFLAYNQTSGLWENSNLTISGVTLDFVNTTGDTMTGTLYAPSFSASTYSGGTFIGDGSQLTGLIAGDAYWTSGSTGLYSIKTNNGTTTDATGDYSVATGRENITSGYSSYIGGYANTGGGFYDFLHAQSSEIRSTGVGGDANLYTIASSILGGLGNEIDFGNNNVAIVGGELNVINSGGTDSVIIGGNGNSINENIERSVILGGQNITATEDDTVYGINANFDNITVNNGISGITHSGLTAVQGGSDSGLYTGDVEQYHSTYLGAQAFKILDGMTLNKPELTLRVSGSSIFIDVEADGGGDIYGIINDNEYKLDCTTGAGSGGTATIELNTGADANNPVTNYVYLTQAGGVGSLNVSTSLPTGAFGWLAKVILPDTTTFNTSGPYGFQRYTESFVNNSRGALSHEREKLRALGAVYISGCDTQDVDIVSAASPDEVHFSVSSGSIYQLHRQTFPQFSGTTSREYYIGNGNGVTQYDAISDLGFGSISSYSDGSAISNGDRYNLVIWGAVNKTTNDCKLFVNIPSAGYGSDAQAIADANSTADYTVPDDLRSVAFLIARIVIRYDIAGGGTHTVVGDSPYSLLGQPVGVRSAGSTSAPASNEFADSLFRIFDDTDTTKIAAFEADQIPSGTENTYTFPSSGGTLALTDVDNGFTSNQTFNGASILGTSNINLDSTSDFKLNRSTLNDDNYLTLTDTISAIYATNGSVGNSSKVEVQDDNITLNVTTISADVNLEIDSTGVNIDSDLTVTSSATTTTINSEYLYVNKYIQGQNELNLGISADTQLKLEDGLITSYEDIVPNTIGRDLGSTGTSWDNVYANTLYGDGSNLTNVKPQLTKTATVESAQTTDDITIFRATSACTIQEVNAVLVGTSPDVNIALYKSNDRSDATPTTVVSSVSVTATTTGQALTVITAGDANKLAAGEWLWMETPTVTTTPKWTTVDVRYTED